MPSEKEISQLYHEDLEHFEPYIAQIPVHRKYFRQKIQEIKKIISPSALLDIGCAMGVLLEEAKKAGFRVQGIDISKDAVMYCRKKKLDVLEGTLSSVAGKLQKNSFDVVTAFEIIEHERNPLGMMRRVHTLLNKGGIAVLTTPNHSGIWRKVMGKWWVGYHHPEHVTFWDPGSLRELFERAGFRDIAIARDSPRPFPLSFVFTRGANYIPWAAWILKPVGKFLDRFSLKNPINPWDDLIVFARK
jgi:SAM-dependent methyltransferase